MAVQRNRILSRCRLSGGPEDLLDEELLELLLSRSLGRRGVVRLARALISTFGSFAEALAASPDRLREAGLIEDAIRDLAAITAAAKRLARGSVANRPILSSHTALLEYCRVMLAFEEREHFRVLFLDKRNALIADERQAVGTIDHVPVYPREVIIRALTLSASALILVHNHPSGDPAPSTADVVMTHEIAGIAKMLGIVVHDHLIIGRHGHASLKALRKM